MIRQEYSRKALVESDMEPDPTRQFDIWWHEAVKAKIIEVNAMTLATASADGIPSARTVLMKGFSEKGFIFFYKLQQFQGTAAVRES